MASCIQFSPCCWGYSWCNNVAPCSFLTFFSRLSPIIYYSLLCKRFTSKHFFFWQPWQQRVALTWREYPLRAAASACRGAAFQGKETFLLLGHWPGGAGSCPQHQPRLGELRSSLCSCLYFHWIPAFACTSVTALLPWSWKRARIQSISDALRALCWNNLTSPQGTRWASTSQARFFFLPYLCVFLSQQLLWLHSSVTQITWGSCDIYPL